MAEHYAEGQYDDDLTVGLDDVTNEAYFDEDDLLKYQSSEEESPLTRLKTLVLSLDWEITDDVLRQCNEELVHLRDLWDGESIYLVYIQALSTISKYIYQKKTDSHPNAIKLLPLLYNNLEKVVHDTDLDDEERKQILLADVSRFNELKVQIAGESSKENAKDVLRKVKAIVLSIDWEITQNDLDQLGAEVSKLELAFKNKKPCLIMLQGIGTLAAYIQHKAGNAHPDAFILIHDFYLALEKFILSKLPSEQEKKILFGEVEKFNAFKKVIASTISPEALKRDASESIDDELVDEGEDAGEVQPAFADVAPDNISGFQEEQEASELEQEVDISAKLDSFFADSPEETVQEEVDSTVVSDTAESVVEEAESRLEDFFDDSVSGDAESIDRATALRGVDVETEADDDSDEEALPVLEGELAPALADNDLQSSFSEGALAAAGNEWQEPEDGFLTEMTDSPQGGDTEVVVDEESSIGFIDESEDFTAVLADVEGVDVETEADDDSDEPPLLVEGDAPAPALTGFGGDGDQEEDDDSEFEDQLGIDSTLDAFFGEDEDVVEDESPSEEVDLLKEYFDEDIEEATDDVAVESPASVSFEDSEVVSEELAVEGQVDDFFVDDTEEELVASIEPDDSIDDSIEEFFAADEEEAVAEPTDIESGVEEEPSVESAVEDFFDFESDEEDQEMAPVLDEVSPALDVSEAAEISFEDSVDVSIEDFFAADEEEVEAIPADEKVIEDDIEVSFEESVTFEAEVDDDPSVESGVGDTIADVAAGAAVATAIGSSIIKTEKDDELSGEDEVVDVVDDISTSSIETEAGEADDEYLVEFIEVDDDTPETNFFDVPDDPYEDLRGCVQSLGIEINDLIIDGLMVEINQMRQKMVSNPLGKSFLQLMSTVAQHISRYQFSSDAGTYELLISVLDGMEKGLAAPVAEGQEIFLTEMYKVLNWQQTMMTQQAVSLVDEPEEVEGISEETSFDEEDSKEELFNEGDDELLYAVLEEEMAETAEDERSEVGVEEIRSELQSLRLTLQEEIAQLRAELTK